MDEITIEVAGETVAAERGAILAPAEIQETQSLVRRLIPGAPDAAKQIAYTLAQSAVIQLEDGELDARIAQSHANLDEWEDSIAAARQALGKGVESGHEMRVLIGMALFELGRLEEAETEFAEAGKSPEARKVATQWLTYIEKEKERLLELKMSLE